jgi:putative Ca2+/H+ antiporter (TMEM165/GDT1 family)
VAGAWLAFLVQTVVAVAAGSVLQLLPAQPVRIAAGLGFLVFAVLALRRNEEEELEEEAVEVAKLRTRRLAPWLACFLVVLAAEFGDLTQLATAALVARGGNVLAIAVASVLALWTVTVIAAVAGAQLSRYLSDQLLTRASAALFAVVGVIVIITALR